MCGIAGIVHSDKSRPVLPERLAAMCQAIAHRGPDDEGVWIGEGVGLGHRRLSIIDLSPAGHQPMSNEDGSVWTILNGEIYNFQELREDLLGRGHSFRSRSDTEVIVHLYEEKGDDCIAALRGMFALAIYDSRSAKSGVAERLLGKPAANRHPEELVSPAAYIARSTGQMDLI
jgi:asparagine synthase (glutamine-hydrolysing)